MAAVNTKSVHVMWFRRTKKPHPI